MCAPGALPILEEDSLEMLLEAPPVHTRVEGPPAVELEVATAAHDLRNRLGIAGCEVHQLRRRLSASGAGVAARLDRVERLLGQINALLEGLLEEACDKASVRVGTSPGTIDLVSLARRVLALEGCDADSALRFTLATNVPQLRGAWDEARMTYLLQALVTNAVNYRGARSEIVVTVNQEDGEAVLRVADRGIGISRSDLPHIFEPFFRTRAAEARAHGLGLGLATARLIVEQYSGVLDADSTEGVGTTVTARLPLLSS
jgi:signal transduction histidine kinase